MQCGLYGRICLHGDSTDMMYCIRAGISCCYVSKCPLASDCSDLPFEAFEDILGGGKHPF